MNNNTLIAGFEDIMTHIKNQEIRIKKLEEDKKELHNIIDSTNADYEKLVDKNNNDNLNFADILSERDDEIKKLKEENEKLKEEIKELEEETTPLTVSGPHRLLQEKNDKLTKELVAAHEYLRVIAELQNERPGDRMTKDIIMNLMIKIIKELCDEDSVDIEKEWQADTRGVKWTDKDYNDFMINICKDMDDDNWNDFGGITLEWKDDTLYFRRVEP
jgi:DNA repair exonuclease SbcCD ATPase subunit